MKNCKRHNNYFIRCMGFGMAAMLISASLFSGCAGIPGGEKENEKELHAGEHAGDKMADSGQMEEAEEKLAEEGNENTKTEDGREEYKEGGSETAAESGAEGRSRAAAESGAEGGSRAEAESGAEGESGAAGSRAKTESEAETGSDSAEGSSAQTGNEKRKAEDSLRESIPAAEIIKTDWSAYFDGFQGAAVIYDVSARKFFIFNKKTALARRSPCSTFKIISSLTALENGIVNLEHSVRKWSGEVFWRESWNKDIDFKEAFRESCVWYYREVIDETGRELIQEELDRLSYGNRDISDWEGRLNTNNNNRALTGFWIESSLKISPKEQTQVMERIFGQNSVYSDETKNTLKEVMLLQDEKKTDCNIYGKTGMGVADGTAVDAWFTGFAEKENGQIYFCVYLGKTDGKEISSAAAREIAVRLVSDY